MTIKALTNMYLLLHLMDREQAGRVRLPYYLDEAADIDERNQAALLETSLQLGFVPILASVKPQVSAHVAIDLEGGSGPNGIYIDEADWKYIRRRDAPPAAKPAQPASRRKPANRREASATALPDRAVDFSDRPEAPAKI